MDDWRPVIAIIAALMGGQTFVNNQLDSSRFSKSESHLEQKVAKLAAAINSQDEDLFKMFIKNQSHLLQRLEDLAAMEMMKNDAIQEFLTELKYLAEGRAENPSQNRLGSE